jgi:hypothetical protein
MGAVFPQKQDDLGGHLFVVEFDPMPDAAVIAKFAAAIDERLSTLNDDYRAHRAEGFGLKAPEVRAVPAGTFAQWMKSRGRLGGQNKVPRIINDQAVFETLIART